MRLRPRLPLNERGAALPTALFAVAVLSVLAAAAATLGKGAIRSSAYWPNHTAALYVAESGINDCVYRLDRLQQIDQQTYPGDSPSFTEPAGVVDERSSYQVWVESLGGMYVLVTSRGTRAGVNRVVQVQVRLSRSCLFWDPDGDGIIEMSENPPRMCDIDVVVDVPDPPGNDLILGNRETMTIGPGTYTYIDVRLGNESRLNVVGPATIYVKDDFYIGNKARMVIDGEVTFYIIDDVDVDQEAVVQVNGQADIWVGDKVSFNQRSTLTGDGATTFWVKNSFIVDNRAQVGSDPTMLTVFMSTETDPDVLIRNDAIFRGGIYNRTGDITLFKDAQVTGAVVGWTVDLKSGADVTYDPEVSSGGPGSTAVVAGTWGEL